MKNRILWLFLMLVALPFTVGAQQFVNLTPVPKSMTVGQGTLVLAKGFTVEAETLSDEKMLAEVHHFIDSFNAVTDYGVTLGNDAAKALVHVATDASLGEEAYSLDIVAGDAPAINIKAAAPAGLYFAFQTLKKILPPNVMAGVKDAAVTQYALPVVSIKDAPRYSYRGFMLDVSRHFFTVDEVKRMLDVMSYYKMNRFHWHLSDDQGWRVEIKKWPKLTTVGSIAPNCRRTDIRYGQYYWTNEPYGPYFYTQEELKDVVAYARERHIEIIPEIDMPGHFVAALVAYPEFSCNPSAGRSVWVNGGISSDVLNVANPAAVQFTKDILKEIMDIFPGEYIHIGGDECPTTAWQNNDECKKMYADLGLTNWHQLQSHFIKDVGEYIVSQGRKVSVWNEAISNSGADTELIQDIDALVYCWTGADAAANKATSLGLKSVYTPQIPYYINRKQRPDDLNAGDGSDNVQRVYNVSPYNAALGVQGTFWTEHVSEPEHLEYQALPRLIAIAEAGWSQQAKRSFTDFQKRIAADSTMLNYNNYWYNRDFMYDPDAVEKVMPTASTAENPYYYRIVTMATDGRSGRCWELLRAGSPLVSTYGDNGAAAGKLWTNAQAAEGDEAYDWQQWGFEEDPDNAGRYALVCRAAPEGSLNPTPSATSTSGRWTYDNAAKHYDFILGEGSYYGESDGVYYYSIRSNKVQGQYLNSSVNKQGFAVNVYNNPADGNGGLFRFYPITKEADEGVMALLQKAEKALAHAVTYEDGEKTVGAYGAAETAALRALVDKANVGNMTEDELAAFTTDLTVAYEAFCNSFGYLEEGKTYRFENAVEGFEGEKLSDDGQGTYLRYTTEKWSNDAWEVTGSTIADGVQSVQLKNAGSGRYVAASATSPTDLVGYPVAVGTTAVEVKLAFDAALGEYTLSSGGKNLFPIPTTSGTLPGIISSGSNSGNLASNAFRPMGTGWHIVAVRVATYNCQDEAGNSLGTFVRSLDADADLTADCPEIKNFRLKSAAVEGDAVKAVYERTAYSMVTEARDTRGAIISREEIQSPVNQTYTVSLPAPRYYTLVNASRANGTTFVPEADETLTAVYDTEALSGVKAVAGEVREVKAGNSYLLYDNSDANSGARKGFRTVLPSNLNVNRVFSAEGATPYSVWTLEKIGNGFKIKNECTGKYVPILQSGKQAVLAAAGGVFTFSANADGSMKVQGSNSMCWDGNENGALVGWNSPGHPILVYEYYAAPYFVVTIKSVDEGGVALAATTSELVKAGDAYTLVTPAVNGYTLVKIENADKLGEVGENIVVQCVFKKDVSSGIEGVEADNSTLTKIYDLSGRRLQQISGSGIYIIGGQKVVVK